MRRTTFSINDFITFVNQTRAAQQAQNLQQQQQQIGTGIQPLPTPTPARDITSTYTDALFKHRVAINSNTPIGDAETETGVFAVKIHLQVQPQLAPPEELSLVSPQMLTVDPFFFALILYSIIFLTILLKYKTSILDYLVLSVYIFGFYLKKSKILNKITHYKNVND